MSDTVRTLIGGIALACFAAGLAALSWPVSGVATTCLCIVLAFGDGDGGGDSYDPWG
jgi:hypothetical protein